MADKRMFSKQITDSDAFVEMPLSTQALYFHLGMAADDDGFVNSPVRTQRIIGCNNDDFNLLIAKGFIIPFDSGVVVIKHWKINNYIRSDRYKETAYIEEKSQLIVKENGAYSLRGIPSGSQVVYADKNRLDKNRLDKSSCCLRGHDKLINRMSEDEVECLFKIYKDADYLIDEVQAIVDKKHTQVDDPYRYIVGYAEHKGWEENGDQ